jgi:hypothetical protein
MTLTTPVDWTVVEDASGSTFRWGYEGDDLVAEWMGVLTLRATRTGELKALQPVPGAPEDLVEKTQHGVATAFLRAQQHQHALHACAVAFEGKALVCVGASGLGKSTMAARMCRHPGVELLADDMAEIEILPGGEVRVLPSEAAVWLATSSSLAKAPVRSSRAATSPAALQCVVSLVFDKGAPNLELREIRGADAVSALIPSLVRFEQTSSLWARELAFIGQLTSRGRVVEARRSHDFAADTLADALLRLLEGKAR